LGLAPLDPTARRADDESMRIGDKTVVRLDYTLKNASGEVIDTSEGSEPLTYLHGFSQIVPGLERELEGMEAGQAKDVVVQPEDGYGLPDPQGRFPVPRTAFPPEANLAEGDSFIGEDDEGQALPVRVIEVRDDVVIVDANHPLAGETLFFHVDVREVRAATADELEHGHSHGEGEHEHE
jgi:FKBP-type peptidyl-prolyl cis-trans isomerase SlyD